MTKEQRDLLVFGYGLSAILTFIAWRVAAHHRMGAVTTALLAIAALMAVITVLRLPALKGVYQYWMKGAHVIGNTLTIIILTILFFAIFTPFGIVIRLLRKDLLDVKLEPQADSYWKRRAAREFNKEQLERQF